MVEQEAVSWTCLVEANAKIAETPAWIPEHKAIYWIDVYGPSLNRTSWPDGATETWQLPETIGSFALYEDGLSALLALQSGLFRFDLRTKALSKLVDAPGDVVNYRLNDGRCDARGRFWVGTVRRPRSTEKDGGASFYRYLDGRLEAQIDGLTIANGLAWSPDSRTMYVADRPNWQILAFDYDVASGNISNRRRFARVPEGQVPDGASVDVDGGYWLALYGGRRIVRFRPDGTLDRDLIAPTKYPTMVAFAGPDLSTMIVTTARVGPDGAPPEPQAGGIFHGDAGVRGLPTNRFKSTGHKA
jgi:L-arabinonolactonase